VFHVEHTPGSAKSADKSLIGRFKVVYWIHRTPNYRSVRVKFQVRRRRAGFETVGSLNLTVPEFLAVHNTLKWSELQFEFEGPPLTELRSEPGPAQKPGPRPDPAT
jgi:hypothetical protein